MTDPLSKADVLARIEAIKSCIGDPLACPHETCAADLDAIAAWLRAACVRDAGHEDGCDDAACTAPHPCWHCGQRRAEEGGQ